MVLQIPVAPTLSSVFATGFTIGVNADGNPGGTYYCFRVITGPTTKYVDNSGSLIDTQTWQQVTSLTAIGAKSNSLYSVSLSAASDAVGTNATSYGPNTSTVTLAGVPQSPIFSSIFSTTVTATWLDHGNPTGTEYFVEISTDPGFTTALIDSGWVTTLGYTFINLLPSTTYYGRVKAHNSSVIETGWVALAPATLPAGPAVIHTLDVQNLLADRGFLLTWRPALETNVIGYNVYRSPSPTDNSSFVLLTPSKPSTAINVTSFTDRVPYTFGITFYYKVTAYDDGGNESSLVLTTAMQDNSFHSFEEQPFFSLNPTLINAIGETVAGAINGSNTLFTTIAAYKPGTLAIYLNGVRQILGIDYNEGPGGNQFTFITAPASLSVIRVDYVRLF